MKFRPTSSRFRAAMIACVSLVAAAVCATAYAQSTTVTTNETVPFSGSLANPCNGDTVTFQGNIHVTNHMTTDAGGGTHLKTHLNFQGVTGTGAPSGLTYNVRTTTNQSVNDSDGPQSEATVISTVKLISQGPPQNYFLRNVFHVTVNANGTTTSTVDETSAECRGGQN